MGLKFKKAAAGVLAAVMMLSIGSTSAFAAGRGCGRNFKDADGDGVCDYAGSVCTYVDLDNDGICDNCSVSGLSHKGCGSNYVDADGDNICDNYGTRQGRRHCGRRNR